MMLTLFLLQLNAWRKTTEFDSRSWAGGKKGIVEAFIRDEKLGNTILAPYQPRDQLTSYSVLRLSPHQSCKLGAEGVMVPCKLFGV